MEQAGKAEWRTIIDLVEDELRESRRDFSDARFSSVRMLFGKLWAHNITLHSEQVKRLYLVMVEPTEEEWQEIELEDLSRREAVFNEVVAEFEDEMEYEGPEVDGGAWERKKQIVGLLNMYFEVAVGERRGLPETVIRDLLNEDFERDFLLDIPGGWHPSLIAEVAEVVERGGELDLHWHEVNWMYKVREEEGKEPFLHAGSKLREYFIQYTPYSSHGETKDELSAKISKVLQDKWEQDYGLPEWADEMERVAYFMLDALSIRLSEEHLYELAAEFREWEAKGLTGD